MSKVKLGDVAIEHKGTCKGSKDGYPIVGLEHLVPDEVTLTAWDEGSDNTFTKMFRKGNVLFGRRRAYLKKAAVAPFDGICSGDITVIEAIPDRILPELLPFIIQNDKLFDFAVGKSAGSLSPRVKWEHLKNYEFELPDMGKQRELAELLWAMDATRKSYQKLIAATDELVKSQFIERFGLPDNNVKGYRLGIIGDVISDVHYGTSAKASGDGKYIYIRMNNITYEGTLDLADVKRIDVADSELENYVVRYGDVLFNRTNSRDLVGKTCVFDRKEPMIIAGYIIRLRMNGQVLPEYLSLFMNTRYAKKLLIGMAKGAVGQANINAKELQEIQIIIPPIDEQVQFLAFVRQSDKSKFAALQCCSQSIMPRNDKLYDFLGTYHGNMAIACMLL